MWFHYIGTWWMYKLILLRRIWSLVQSRSCDSGRMRSRTRCTCRTACPSSSIMDPGKLAQTNCLSMMSSWQPTWLWPRNISAWRKCSRTAKSKAVRSTTMTKLRWRDFLCCTPNRHFIVSFWMRPSASRTRWLVRLRHVACWKQLTDGVFQEPRWWMESMSCIPSWRS